MGFVIILNILKLTYALCRNLFIIDEGLDDPYAGCCCFIIQLIRLNQIFCLFKISF